MLHPPHAGYLRIRSTPLHAASMRGHAGVVDLLLEAGAHLDMCEGGTEANTPLHRAAAYNQIAVVRRLLDAGADVNCVNKTGGSALDVALVNASVEAVQLLGATGAVAPKYGQQYLCSYADPARTAAAADAPPPAVRCPQFRVLSKLRLLWCPQPAE